MRHVDLGHDLEQLARQMDGRPHASRSEGQLVARRAGLADQVVDALDAGAGRHHQDVGRGRHHADGHQVALPVVGVALHGGVGRHIVGRHRDGVAIGRRLRQRLDRDIAAGSRAVFDNECLVETLAQLLGVQAGEQVGRAARREAHVHPHRLVRIRVGPAGCTHGSQTQYRGQQSLQHCHESISFHF
ncbi:hypothetical protein D3C72_1399600 [compost metagenome]